MKVIVPPSEPKCADSDEIIRYALFTVLFVTFVELPDDFFLTAEELFGLADDFVDETPAEVFFFATIIFFVLSMVCLF